MRILIVEDDAQKLRDIEAEVRSLRPVATIATAVSYKSGVKAALKGGIDLLIVDMTLPTVDVKAGDRGYKMLTSGGADIVHELTDEKMLPSCILISSFDELGTGRLRRSFRSIANDLGSDIGPKLLGAVLYDGTGQRGWRDELGGIFSKSVPA